MCNVELVTVVDSADDLTKVSDGFMKLKTAFRDEVIEKLSPFHIFKQQVPRRGCGEMRKVAVRVGLTNSQIVFILIHVIHVHDVLVVDQLHHDHFAPDTLHDAFRLGVHSRSTNMDG